MRYLEIEFREQPNNNDLSVSKLAIVGLFMATLFTGYVIGYKQQFAEHFRQCGQVVEETK